MQHRHRPLWQAHLAMASAAVLFGSGFVVTKLVVSHVPAATWVCVRVLASSLILLALFRPVRQIRSLGWSDHRYLIACSVFGIVLNQMLFTMGLQRSTPAYAVLINGLIPVFTMLIGSRLGGDRITLSKGVGFALGLAGLAYLLELDRAGWSSATWVGDWLNLANALSYSVFLAISRPAFQRYGWRTASTLIFLWGVPGAALIGGWPSAYPDWHLLPAWIGWAMAFLILGPTVGAYTANAWAMETVEASQVAAYVYVQPIVAIAMGYLWLGDPITPRLLVSCLLIFAGITLANVLPSLRQGRESG